MGQAKAIGLRVRVEAIGEMSDFFYLIPISLALGLAGLVLFLWSLKNGQYEDLDGASERILYDDDRPSEAHHE